MDNQKVDSKKQTKKRGDWEALKMFIYYIWGDGTEPIPNQEMGHCTQVWEIIGSQLGHTKDSKWY